MAAQLDSELGPGSTASLMAAGSLADRLEATLTAVRAADFVAASTEYAQVDTTLAAMSASAATWQSKLAAALGGPAEESGIMRLLETILAYVEAWGSGVDAYTTRITEAVPRLDAFSEDTWRSLALARVQANAPEESVRATVDELIQVTAILRHWFCGSLPQAQRFRRQMRDAVAPVLRSHRTLLAVGGTVSRKADLVRLARHRIRARRRRGLADLDGCLRLVLGTAPSGAGPGTGPSAADRALGRSAGRGIQSTTSPGPAFANRPGGETARQHAGPSRGPPGRVPRTGRPDPGRGGARSAFRHHSLGLGPAGFEDHRTIPRSPVYRPQPS